MSAREDAIAAGLPHEEPAVTMRSELQGDFLSVLIEDNGPGLTNPANLFVPFYTTKKSGSGVGLVLARQIAEAHGGTLELRNRADGSWLRGGIAHSAGSRSDEVSSRQQPMAANRLRVFYGFTSSSPGTERVPCPPASGRLRLCEDRLGGRVRGWSFAGAPRLRSCELHSPQEVVATA